MLRRHLNPLDVIFDALSLEVRGIRLEHLATRILPLGISAETVQEGADHWVSRSIMQLTRGGPLRAGGAGGLAIAI